jgi:hypothetical protein
MTRATSPIQVTSLIKVIKSWAAIVTEDKPVSSLFLRNPGRQIHPGHQSHPDHQILAAIVAEEKQVSSLFLRDRGRQIHPGLRHIQAIKSWATIVTEDKPVSSLLLCDPGRQIHPGHQVHPRPQVLFFCMTWATRSIRDSSIIQAIKTWVAITEDKLGKFSSST